MRGSVPGRVVHLIAEDDRNLARLVTPAAGGGWGLDAVWADDFHHQMRRLLAGDADGYFRDYTGTTDDVADTLAQGWFYTGQHSIHADRERGTDPAGVPLKRFVVCLQNHDQIGNRAVGDRLHHAIDLAAFRAASVLLLTAPETPLLFMGQEWAASSPFQYFTDHAEPLGRLVSEGRRREFATFTAFAADGPQTIPDPQAPATFEASRLRWEERTGAPHASILRLYSALLAFRRAHLGVDRPGAFHVMALDDATIGMRRSRPDGGDVLVVARLSGSGVVTLGSELLPAGDHAWTCHLTSEDDGFATPPAPPVISGPAQAPSIRFTGPAAVVLMSGTS